MLQQQNFLCSDPTATLDMIAKDDSGKGDWGVRRKVKKKWEEIGTNSEEKWALFESEIKRLSEGKDVGQQRWAVSVRLGIGEYLLKLYPGGVAVVCRRNHVDTALSKIRHECIQISKPPTEGTLQHSPSH